MKKTSFIENAHVEYDPSLDDYSKNNPNPFPRKMASAIALVDKHEAQIKKRIKKINQKHLNKQEQLQLSILQTELLAAYAFNPTDKQMQQLKTFLQQLFNEELIESVSKREEELVA